MDYFEFDYIFVNEFGNITFLDYFLFKGNDSSDFNDVVNEGINLLSVELESILKDETLSKFIKYIAIESYVDSSEVTEANKLLSNQRSFKFLNALLNANNNLKEYSNKFISSVTPTTPTTAIQMFFSLINVFTFLLILRF